MEMKNQSSLPDIPVTINCFAGTTVLAIPAGLKYLCKRAGLKYKDIYKDIAFDFTQLPQTGIDDAISNENFILARLPKDKLSIQQAEEKGYFNSVAADFHLNPGVTQDDYGASASPPIGDVFIRVNDKPIKTLSAKLMRGARDFIRTQNIAKDGLKTDDSARIPINMFIGTAGGTGTGSLKWNIAEIIPSCEKETGIDAKVSVHLIMQGNLPVQNKLKAKLNELTTFKYLSSVSTGKYIDPAKGILTPIPFSNIYLYSNLNFYGNILELKRLIVTAAHTQFFRFSTPAGKLMAQRAIDVEGISFDDYGNPLPAITTGYAAISRDSKRGTDFCKLISIGMFCESLLKEHASEEIAKEAVAFVWANKLVESDEENHITSNISHPEEMNRESVFETARQGIANRINNTGGFKQLLTLDESIAFILNSDIPALYEPVMQAQSQKRANEIAQALKKIIEQKKKTSHGLIDSIILLQNILALCHQSLSNLHGKISQAQEYLNPHQQILAEISEQINRLRQRNPIVRIFFFLLIRRLNRDLLESGQAAIRHQMELSCCQAAINDLLMPLIESLENKIAWLHSETRKMSNISQFCQNSADKLAGEDTMLQNPSGYELTDKAYLEDYIKRFIKKCGGKEKFCEYLQSLFINKYNTFDILTENSQQQVFELLNNLFHEILESEVKSTTVLDEFIRYYPENIRTEMLIQILKQSEGSIRIEGSLAGKMTWIKTANVPSSGKFADQMAATLETLDKKDGKWETADSNDIDYFSICQLCGGISLVPLIHNIDVPDNEAGWKMAVEQAVDPVTAIMVNPNPNIRQFKRVLAKAIVSELLSFKGNAFYLKTTSPEPMLLGKNLNEIMAKSRHLWPDMVFVESLFARGLVVAEQDVISCMNNLYEDIEHGNNSDARLSLIDKTAISECLKQTEILLPRLRRYHKNLLETAI